MDLIKERVDLCEKSITETFEQIKMMQNRHQQLIGYKQALLDVISDLEVEEQKASLELSTESISPKKKQSAA